MVGFMVHDERLDAYVVATHSEESNRKKLILVEMEKLSTHKSQIVRVCKYLLSFKIY